MTRQKLSVVDQARAAMPGLEWSAHPEHPACAVGRDWNVWESLAVYVYRDRDGRPGRPWKAEAMTATGWHFSRPCRTCAAALKELPRLVRDHARRAARCAALDRDAARDLQRRIRAA